MCYPIFTSVPHHTPHLYILPYAPPPHPSLQIPGYHGDNQDGRSEAKVSKEMCALQHKIASLESIVASLQSKEASQAKKIASLEDRVSNLTMPREAYKLLRNRFISTFKRDKLHNATREDYKMIAEGNRWAHGGDAVVDAQLYKGTIRRGDECDFERLYGLPPSIVARLS